MGSFTSSLVPADEEAISMKLTPSNPRWIPAHVEACNSTIIKVQRCWHRFVQLGCDRNGNLTSKAKIYSSTDKFLKQVLALIPKNAKNVITFQVFVNACVWLESAQPETKMKLMYYLLNKGEPVNALLLSRVIAHLYESVPQAELQEIASITVQEICQSSQGYFNEEQFLAWAISKPAEDIEKQFAFSILPN